MIIKGLELLEAIIDGKLPSWADPIAREVLINLDNNGNTNNIQYDASESILIFNYIK